MLLDIWWFVWPLAAFVVCSCVLFVVWSSLFVVCCLVFGVCRLCAVDVCCVLHVDC